ncbi:MAG: flagellar filament capping protein FliD [Firmicutes bacterium]|nr:flagellar filament capping protein FliD [Bacillota bacterium]
MSSDLRIPGLNTGMDTQETINKIMKYSKMPLTRLKQKQQLLIWKQEAYRAQNTALTQLRDLVFNLKLQANYNTKTVSSTNTQAITATANSNAANASYSITVSQLAEAATNTSSAPVSVRSAVTGNGLDLGATPVTIDSLAGNNQINVTVDGVTKTLTLSDGVYDGTAGHTLADLAADIQTQLNNAGFSAPVYVKANSNNQLVFYAAQKPNGTAHTIVLEKTGADATLTNLGFADKANTRELVGNILTGDPVIVSAANKKFKIALDGGAAQEVTLAEGTYNLNDFATEIQSKIQALGGAYAAIEVSVTSLNQLRISSANAAPSSIKVESASSSDVLWKMGFTSGTTSEYPKNNINPTTPLWNQKDKFINTSFFNGKTATSYFRFSINGQEFSFGLNRSLSEIINTINSNSAAGVIVSYDEFNDKLTFTAKKTGDNNPDPQKEIQLTDTDGFLGQLFNISQAGEIDGKNAQFTINGVTTERPENNFTINGVNFSLKGLTPAGSPATVTVATDTSNIVSKITDFVNKYNEIIDAINAKLRENRVSAGNKYTFYQPLTEEEKKELSADEIKAWEEKAKQGLLHNDSILSGALSAMRVSLSRNIDTPRVLTGVSLSGTIDFTGSNRFTVTLGSQTREISLDERSYTSGEYNLLTADLQRKLDMAFGTNRIRVAVTSNNELTFTSQNASMTLANASQNNGLGLLGFSNGATVKATFSQLSQIGITTGYYTEKGKLHLDTDALQNALANDPDGVLRLLTNNETITAPLGAASNEIANAKNLENDRKGIFISFYDTLAAQIKKITSECGLTGTVSYGNELGRELIRVGEQIDSVQDRVTAEENRLWKIFSQMEVAIGKMNEQYNWLSSITMNQSGRY